MKLFSSIPLMVCLLGTAAPLIAQDSSRTVTAAGIDTTAPTGTGLRVGVYGEVDAQYHSAGFGMLPGVPNCCTSFSEGTGEGFSIGAVVEYMLSERWTVGGRLAYEDINAKFRAKEPTTFIVGGRATDAAFEHQLDAWYSQVMIAPVASYRMTEGQLGAMNMVGHIGLGVGIKARSSYGQREKIVEPAGIGVYTDTETDTRNAYSGDIPESNPVMAELRFGLGLDLPLDGANVFMISPELWYSFGLTPVVRSIDWSVNELRVGLVLRYALPAGPAAVRL